MRGRTVQERKARSSPLSSSGYRSGAKPALEHGVHLGAAEEIHVTHAQADPLPLRGKGQRQLGPRMPAQRAVDGNQSVAAGLAAFYLRGGGGGCEALHAQRERQRSAAVASVLEAVAPLPVLVAHVAMAQVGDPRAADLSQAGEGRAVATD